MKMKVTYIAVDGTEFEDREECQMYETSLTTMCEHVRFYDRYFKPIEWNPGNYESMWNHLYYIVIEPHHEQEVEDWWDSTFNNMLGVSPFGEINDEWCDWKYHDHGDEPTVFAFDFGGNDSWIIFNTFYNEAKEVTKRLDLVDALS